MSTADDPVPVTALRPLPTGSPRRPSGEPRPPASRPLHVIRDQGQREPAAQEPELRRLLDRGARELAGLLAGDRELTAEHLAVVAARTRQLAAKGLPLPVLLGALKDAGGELLHTLPDTAADVPSLLATSSRACRVIGELTRAITEAYVEAHRWQAQDIRQLLADTLLRGEDGLA
ncbi:MAG TPA: hypothetical protein VKP11_03145, partial [Frankiaceae bacterium]|nr:hypothetical protein [Frankiaceae bacterium]